MLSVVGTPGDVAGIWKISTMQEMTSEICTETATHDAKQLEDTRDGKKYWVTKMKDGNCWMTQNLDYDDPNTSTVFTTTLSGWPNSTSQYAQFRAYYDPGDYTYTTEKAWENCGDQNLGLSSCRNIGYKPTSEVKIDGTWTATEDESFVESTHYFGTDGTVICDKAAGSLLGQMTSEDLRCRIYYYKYADKDFMQHYHSGNYYSWETTTNGTGDVSATYPYDASGSICPSGWRLPTSSNENVEIGSFAALFRAYTEETGYDSFNPQEYGLNLMDEPFYFMPGGFARKDVLVSAGYEAFYWSSTAYSDTSAWYFEDISNNNVNTHSNSGRSNGASVRCLVLGS